MSDSVKTSSSDRDIGETRSLWTSLARGFIGRCPRCGGGRLFRAYLKVYDRCPICGEELHHQRADDAPPYFTILVVGHIVGAGILTVDEIDDQLPVWIHLAIWPALTVVLCLSLLPRIKGALIGLQWANKMHGFATSPTIARRAAG